jgi:hypothetical protein
MVTIHGFSLKYQRFRKMDKNKCPKMKIPKNFWKKICNFPLHVKQKKQSQNTIIILNSSTLCSVSNPFSAFFRYHLLSFYITEYINKLYSLIFYCI